MAFACTGQLRTVSFPVHLISSNTLEFRSRLRFNRGYSNWKREKMYGEFVLRALCGSSVSSDPEKPIQHQVITSKTQQENAHPLETLWQSVASLPPVVSLVKRCHGTNFAIGLCIVATLLVIAVRVYLVRKSMPSRHGSVADLVRRGQLRSDRRGISSPLKYEDPFNNPLVKIGQDNSTVEMCGKVYRLAPVTLTKEQQAIHQKRRSRAYQWKRPTVFLREGDSIPPDVDPDTVRWIPANHPFATTASDIDEDLAQNNVYQKHGVPFRIQAEHEALQRKLESLQNEQKLNNMVVYSGTAKDFERPFKSLVESDGLVAQSPVDSQEVPKPVIISDPSHNSSNRSSPSEDMQKR